MKLDIRFEAKQLLEFFLLIIIIPIFEKVDADIWTILSVEVILLSFFICLKNINSNIYFFFFLVSFFIYLMSGDIAELFFHRYYYLRFEDDAVIHAHLCIFISLLGLYLGYILTKSPKNFYMKKYDINYIKKYIITLKNIRFISKKIYFITYLFLIFNTIDTIRFVSNNGYIAYYTSFTPMLPLIFVKIGEFTFLVLCIYLSTFPTKKESFLVISSYLFYSLLVLFIGSRSGIVYNTIFILCYCFYRNKTDKGKSIWISKKIITILLVCVPFILSFLFLYEFIRTGRSIEFTSIGDAIIDFFVNIGSSSQIIKYGYVYRDEIPNFKFYSLGGTLNYFKYGRLFNLFSPELIPPRHSVEFATQSHAFSAILPYLVMKEAFLNGQGTGSSFIAELFADFKYWGVGFGSMIYGWFFKKMSYISNKNWLLTTIKLYIFHFMLSAPRGSYDNFISGILNISNIVVVLSIWFLAKIYQDFFVLKIKKEVKINEL